MPDPHALRRNSSTIPTTDLPVDGREGPPPSVPAWFDLGPQGTLWWEWAWQTPEAAGWTGSHVDIAGQRATLVDDLWALDHIGSVDVLGPLETLDEDDRKAVVDLMQRLAGLAGRRLAVVKTMAVLDVQLGFGAKNLAALRWKVTDPDADDGAPASGSKPAAKKTAAKKKAAARKRAAPKKKAGARGRLKVVDGDGG